MYLSCIQLFLCLSLDWCEADGNASSSWIPLNSPACLIIWLLWQPAPRFKITSTCSERPPPPECYRSTQLLASRDLLKRCSHLTARMNNILCVYMSTVWEIINIRAMHLRMRSIRCRRGFYYRVIKEKRLLGGKNDVIEEEGGKNMRGKCDVGGKGDQKWDRWVNSWYKKWGDMERNEGWKKRMNDLWQFLRPKKLRDSYR